MRTRQQVWDELDAALQFPSYFGRNWDAVIDCLRDTAWETKRSYILLIQRAEETLADDAPAGLEHLIGVFSSVAEQLTEEHQWSFDEEERPRPFHVLFHTNSPSRWEERLSSFTLPLARVPIRNPASWE